MATTNLGLYQIPTTSPEYEAGSSPVSQLSAALATLDGKHAVEVDANSGAIAIKQGLVAITKATVAAMTLAAPTAGLPAAGGHDGQILRVLDTTGAAHTVTTPTNKINGALHVATFGGASTPTIGDFVEFVAYGGVWYVLGSTGVQLT